MRGKFFVIDGPDGNGKATQTKLLAERMRREKLPVHEFSFPRYNTPTGRLVRQYLRGAFGDPLKIDARFASGLYAADRLAAAPEIEFCLRDGGCVVTDRYVAANMGHQGSKMEDARERAAYFAWAQHHEYEVNGIPKPDLNVILHVPANVAIARVEGRGLAKDGHENEEHLRAAERTYLEIARTFPGFALVSCVDGNRELTKEEVHEKVWALVAPVLKAAATEPAKAMAA